MKLLEKLEVLQGEWTALRGEEKETPGERAEEL